MSSPLQEPYFDIPVSAQAFPAIGSAPPYLYMYKYKYLSS